MKEIGEDQSCAEEKEGKEPAMPDMEDFGEHADGRLQRCGAGPVAVCMDDAAGGGGCKGYLGSWFGRSSVSLYLA